MSHQASRKESKPHYKRNHGSQKKSPHGPKVKSETFQGVIRTNQRGMGFVRHPDKKGLFARIQPEQMMNAFNRDTVIVKTTGEVYRDDLVGKIIEIKERGKKTLVGELDTTVSGDFAYVVPDDKKFHKDIKVFDYLDVPHGNKVFVEIENYPEGKSPLGKILKDLGVKGSHETEMISAVYENGFTPFHSPEIEQEAQRIKDQAVDDFEKEIPNRKDMRGIPTITIDPADAKDFDDALSIETLPNGNYSVGVHIADVSHYIERSSPMDTEAFERSFSVYLVDRTIPMLPEVLSNDLCSLKPQEDRLAFSAIFEIDKEANIVDEWFGKTIIYSDHRYAYEDAQKVADGELEGPLKDEINIFLELAAKLETRKKSHGAISFESDEFKFRLDDKGVPIEVYKKERLPIHKMIEEFMLLANKQVASFISKWDQKQTMKEKGGMYRVHASPDVEKLAELEIFLKIMGYEIKLRDDGTISPKELNAIIDKAHGEPEEALINTTAIRTMQKAEYSIRNEGHFGLAFDDYTHFTSPIRRYPDLTVHRILFAILESQSLNDGDVAHYSKVAEHSSTQEIAAAEAERTSVKYKQTEFMANHIGETFTGIISGITEWGFYVALDDTGAEGMVKAESLPGEFFLYDEKLYRYRGEKTGKIYRLGDPVTVTVTAANVEAKEIDMEISEQNTEE